MNALANSQMKELEKFIGQSDLPDRWRPTFARYTGQETNDEREDIRRATPANLLTNFMMLELLMTRQNALERAVIYKDQGERKNVGEGQRGVRVGESGGGRR